MKNMTKKIIIFSTIFSLIFLPEVTLAETERIPTMNVFYDAIIKAELYIFDEETNLGIINIIADPGSQAMNAVGIYATFPTSTIEIKGIMKEGSFLEFLIENEIDNEEGYIKISGGRPHPGEENKSIIAQVIYEKRSEEKGNFEISLENSMILANNGYGTNVLSAVWGLEL